MNRRSRPPFFLGFVIFVILVSLGSGCFFRKQPSNTANSPDTLPLEPPPPPDTVLFPPPSRIPTGTTVKIAGSTSLVTITQNLKTAFETKFPGTTLETQANSNETGIQAVLAERADLAGISRVLSPQEQTQGLVAVPIASDQIAVVVDAQNPYKGGLTQDQVDGIFSGQITNWSEVGGQNATIRVLNPPPESETYQSFQELVLQGRDFGNSPEIQTLSTNAIAELLQQLGDDGISYASFAEVANQKTLRTVPVEGVEPTAISYPYQRQLSYVYKNPASVAVEGFLGYITSTEGQQVMFGKP